MMAHAWLHSMTIYCLQTLKSSSSADALSSPGIPNVLRMKTGQVEVIIAVGWFLIQCSGDVIIAKFHSGVQ